MPNRPSEDFGQLRQSLHEHLFEFVMPFWLRHAIDGDGGINTCIRDDGTLVNRDKYLWSQWRALWVFSRLYDAFGREEKWLDVARSIYEFSSRFGWDDEVGGWRLRLSHDGKVLDGCETIYTDGFALFGLTEYARATGQDAPAALARKTAESALRRLAAPDDQIPAWPYPNPPGSKVHGIRMVFSLALWQLGRLLNEQRYCDAAMAMSEEIFNHFYRPDRDLILERISTDNSEYPPPLGTTVLPGHVIEDMWFQIHIARDMGDEKRIAEACRLIRRHVELGWDSQYGGITLALDADGRPDAAWKSHSAKMWWVHAEAMYALLLAYEHTRENWCLDWFDKVHEYSFSHYPVAEHGEWRQNLDRRGRPLAEVVALPVKDPFHLPRALIYCLDVLDRLTKKPNV